MSNSKMGAEEQKYLDKSNKMDDFSIAMTWVIGIAGFLMFVCAIAAGIASTATWWILFGCVGGVLVTAIVLKILFQVISNTYNKQYQTLRKEREEREAQEQREREEREAQEQREREERKAQEKRERKEREAQEKREREEREAQEKREQQEKNEQICANEGHIFVEQPYENKNFGYKPELFTCLPLDFCVTERCSRCGAERKKVLDEYRKLDLSPKMECPILYNDKVVGRYELSLSLNKSYCMRAKKDIPSNKIKKGDLFLVLNPRNSIYYNEQGLSISPEKAKEQTDRIYDDGEMPGLVELEKYIAFVDDETHDILSLADITVESEAEYKYFGTFNIGLLRIPEKGSLKVFCKIKE